ncbi:prepilin-type N-terminal cleavage/methylation domain-containing protein [bacterium]|nr:prepilin-type N-terminal cleavage/methylation domain-containing protein [bacterium]
MKSPTNTLKCSTGFTLLEVLVAFSLLAILLTVIIQSQGETAFFLEKTGKLALVQKEVINELSRIERIYSSEAITASEGTFEEGHVLAGDKWQKEIVQEDFLGLIPVLRITYRIIWIPVKGQKEQYFESSIIGEVK